MFIIKTHKIVDRDRPSLDDVKNRQGNDFQTRPSVFR